MFDFTTTAAPPVPVTINGVPYQLPRLLGPQFVAWVAERQKAQVAEAMKALGDDDDKKAQFLLYYQPAPVDVSQLAAEALTPEGCDYVIGVSLKAAGVPADVIAAFTANVHPETKRTLAWHLSSAQAMAEALRKASGDPGAKGNPTNAQPPTSDGSRTTTAETDSPSPESAPASTQAA